MGLLHKALSAEERKAGPPENAGTGLFAKALLSRDKAEEAPEAEPSAPEGSILASAAGTAETASAASAALAAAPQAAGTDEQCGDLPPAKPSRKKRGLLERASRAKSAPSAAVETKSSAAEPSEGHVEIIPLAPPRQAMPKGKNEDYPLGVRELSTLQAEMRNYNAGPDSLFSAFCRIAEALPLSGLALYTAYDGYLRLSALIGFEADRNALIEEREFERPDGKPFDSSPYITAKPGAPAFNIRYIKLKNGALWIFGDPRLDTAPEKIQNAVADIFRSIPEGGPYPAPSYEAAGKHTPLGKQWTTACLLDAAELPLGRKPLVWLTEYGRATILRSGAEYVLGEEGWALLAGDALMLALIYSRQKTDEVLALYQIRKSLARALPSFRDIELPKGKALAIEGDGKAAEDALRRFIGQ